MFIVGLIVGIIVGIVIGVAGVVLVGKHFSNMTWEEYGQAGVMFMEAGNNRESTMYVVKDDVVLSEMTLVER